MGISLHGHPRPVHSFESKESLEENINRKLRKRERSYRSKTEVCIKWSPRIHVKKTYTY